MMAGRIIRAKRTDRRHLEFYCSWGHHDATIQRTDLVEKFEQGTMCMVCQLAIVENVTRSIFMPEVTAAISAAERKKFDQARRERELMREVKEAAPADEVTGIVYYMRINGQIKIGYTADLRQRSRHYPPGTELLAIEPATKYTERDRHQQFHRDLARGREWFTESPAITAHITEMAGAHGVPDDLMWKFTGRDTPRVLDIHR